MNAPHKRMLLLFLLITGGILLCPAQQNYRQLYQLRKYSLSGPEQEGLADYYLEEALLPALKRLGIGPIGAFKSRNKTEDKLHYIFVLYPIASLNQLRTIDWALSYDELYHKVGAPFLDAPYDQPAYERMESVLMKAFSGMPVMKPPRLEGPWKDRVYELRSYESPTEAKYRNKVAMFNQGGEITLFQKLGFNAVFYGEVLSGARMPNLMYMTTFKDMSTRDSLWVEFFESDKWKSLEKDPVYQHNVNHADIFLLYPAPYSEY